MSRARQVDNKADVSSTLESLYYLWLHVIRPAFGAMKLKVLKYFLVVILYIGNANFLPLMVSL